MAEGERRQQTQLRQRGDILAAAAVLFARSGAGGATMADVARHAGVAVGTLYKFFPSKQALHLALLEERAASILAHDAAIESRPASRLHVRSATVGVQTTVGPQKTAGAEALLAEDDWRTWLDKDPQRRERNGQIRRVQILAAASTLLQERGYDGAAMADIAQAAGVATGTLYNFFPSKEALFYTLIEEMAGVFFAHLRKEVESIPATTAKIVRLVEAEFAYLEANRAFLRIYLSARSGFDWAAQQELREAFGRQYAGYLVWLGEILAEGMDAGALRRTDPRELALALVGMLNAVLFEWTVDGGGLLSTRAERITRLFFEGAACGS